MATSELGGVAAILRMVGEARQHLACLPYPHPADAMHNHHAYAFASDNTAPATPEAMQALLAANQHAQLPSYGADAITEQAAAALRDYFEAPDAEVFFVFAGTAANSLAISSLRRSFESVFCTHEAHIEKDESAAPEFFAQGLKLHLVGDARGDKIDLAACARVLAGNRGMHSAQPRVMSITQSSEFGTCYRVDELKSLRAFCDQHALHLHMDGARFANALASTGATPAELSWKAGVDVLSLGGTKNGVCASEVLIYFKPELARGVLNLRKQGGQLLSKMRFLSAPWLGALPHFIARAQHANSCAAKLAAGIQTLGFELAFPVEVNGIFVHMPDGIVEKLHQRGWHFYKFLEPDVHRLMCAWNTEAAAITAFLADLEQCL
jgi:threonine aldolase